MVETSSIVKALFIALSSIVLLAASGCQTTTGPVSIEAAKRLTGEFGGKSFTVPPRTVTDITSVLKKQAQDDLVWVEEARKQVDTAPPDTDNTRTLAQFYYVRGSAASKLGRSGQAISDFRLAVDNARPGRDWDAADMGVWLLGIEDVFAGSFSQAVKDWQNATEYVAWQEDKVIAYAMLADLYAKAGDPEGVKLAAQNSKKYQRMPDYRDQSLVAEWRSARKLREASLLDVSGRYQEAEALYLESLEAYESFLKLHGPSDPGDEVYNPMMLNWLRGNIADNMRKQGRLVEAEVWARRALLKALQFNGRFSGQTSYMLGRLTRIIYEQGRFEDAAVLAQANLDAYAQIGATPDSLQYARARVNLADSLAAQDRWPEALDQYEQARISLSTDVYATRKFIAGNVNWGVALLETGRTEEAITVFDEAHERLAPIYGAGHYALAEVAGFKAKALAETGKRDQALQMFSTTVPVLLEGARKNQSQGADATTRTQKLRSILESYMSLLADVRGTSAERQFGIDAASESFRIANAARMHSVQQALSASGARAAVDDPVLADLIRREQDAKHQADALLVLLTDLLSRPTSERADETVRRISAEAEQLQRARAAILEQIELQFPSYADLINPRATTPAQVQSALHPGEAMVSTYAGRKRTFVWAIPKTGAVAFSTSKLHRDELIRRVERLRVALEPNVMTLGDIPDFDVATAYQLYRDLLVPVRAGWKDADSLLVVADSALGSLPLSLLPTEPVKLGPEQGALFANYRKVPWLARTHAVTVLPSVASLVTLRGVPSGSETRKPFAGFGDPYFSPQQAAMATQDNTEQRVAVPTSDGTRALPISLRASLNTRAVDSASLLALPRLPDTRQEILAIANLMGADPAQDVFLGRDASEKNAKTRDLSEYKVLSFATHGLVSGDLDGLDQPALALSSPMVTGDTKSDGLLTMGEVLGLKLNADWVVLSACNTAAGEGQGAEAISGLGRAFFYAGSRALLVSNWPVHSTATTELMTTLFKTQADDKTLSRAEALRRTMVTLIDGPGYVDPQTGQTHFSYAHPIFWAPFALVGDGG